LVLPLDKTQVVVSESIKGTISDQMGGIGSAISSMRAAARLLAIPTASIQGLIANQNNATLLQSNSVAFELQHHPIYYELILKPVVNGPFWDSYVVTTQLMTVPKGIDLESTSTP